MSTWNSRCQRILDLTGRKKCTEERLSDDWWSPGWADIPDVKNRMRGWLHRQVEQTEPRSQGSEQPLRLGALPQPSHQERLLGEDSGKTKEKNVPTFKTSLWLLWSFLPKKYMKNYAWRLHLRKDEWHPGWIVFTFYFLFWLKNTCEPLIGKGLRQLT